MATKVGNYINPVTGEDDWVVMEEVTRVVLPKTPLAIFGDQNRSSFINYKFSYNQKTELVEMTGGLDFNHKKVYSEIYTIQPITFADALKETVYSMGAFEDTDLIKGLTEQIKKDIQSKLLANGIFGETNSLFGEGYIIVNGDRMFVFDTMQYAVGTPHKITIKAKNVVSSASIDRVEKPSLVFKTTDYTINIPHLNELSSTDGSLFTIDLTATSISLKNEANEILFTKPMSSLQPETDEYEEEYNLRFNQLTGLSETAEDVIEDRFDDLFDF